MFLGVELGNYCNLTPIINVLKEGRKPILRFCVLYEGCVLYIVIKCSGVKATGNLKPISKVCVGAGAPQPSAGRGLIWEVQVLQNNVARSSAMTWNVCSLGGHSLQPTLCFVLECVCVCVED